MNARDEAEQQRLDWALGEKLGGETPPDQAAGIVARHQRGERGPVHELEGARAPARRWLAAALLVLGLGVVFAVALRGRARQGGSGAPDQAPAQQPARAPAPEVRTVADVDALPASTRAVIVRDGGDDVAAALLRLRDLEDLEVHVGDREVFGLMPQAQRAAPRPSLTRAGLDALCGLGKLRRLVLSGTFAVRAAGPGDRGVLDGLLRLPLLGELALRYFDVDDAEGPAGFDVLPKLAALRRLDLSFDHGFGARGIDMILRCQQLEALSLRGCQQLHGSLLARLGGLPALRELDVSLIDGIDWRNVPGEESDPAIAATLARARAAAQAPGAGVTDEALRGIARCRELRRLDLASGRFTDAGVAALAGLAQLEELDLTGAAIGDGIADDLPPGLSTLRVGSDRLTDAFCRRLRARLTRLARLDVSACYGLRDAGVAELAAMPSLRALELRQMRGLTSECIMALQRAAQLVELDLRHCDFVTAAHVVVLRRARPHLRLQTSVPDDALQAAEKQPPAADGETSGTTVIVRKPG